MRRIWTVRLLPPTAEGNRSYGTRERAEAYQALLARNGLMSEVIESEYEAAPRGFSPPTLDEVRAYARSKGYAVDAECFVAFYESKGWRIGKAPMKSWKGAVVTWAKRSRVGSCAQGYQQGSDQIISHF